MPASAWPAGWILLLKEPRFSTRSADRARVSTSLDFTKDLTARPGSSSSAPIFGTSPQYCARSARSPRSILRSLVESRDVETLTRSADLVVNLGSFRLSRVPSDSQNDTITKKKNTVIK